MTVAVREPARYTTTSFDSTTPSLTGGNRGTVLVHDNLITKYDGGNVQAGQTLALIERIYSSGPPFYGADGSNPWDLNATEPDGTHVDGHPPFLFESGTISSGDYRTITSRTERKTGRPTGGQASSPTCSSHGATAHINSNTKTPLRISQWQSQGFAAGNAYEIHKVFKALDQPGRLGKRVGTMDRNSPDDGCSRQPSLLLVEQR